MVEFMFKATNLDNPAWTSIFHMTIGGNGHPINNLGDRNPAIFFNPSSGLLFCYALKDVLEFRVPSLPAPAIDKWTKYQMSQEMQDGKMNLKFFIDEEEKLSVENSKAASFQNVKVYASDPWYAALPGSIKNLSIKTKR